MAVPGDTECREVLPCGDGRWGDLPPGVPVTYVDSNYAGDGNGQEDTPYSSIQAAINNASEGDIIVIAPGEYYESLRIETHAVTLRGACATTVDIRGDGSGAPVIDIHGDDVQLQNLGISSAPVGVVIWDSFNVDISGLWAHALSERAISIEADADLVHANISDTLIEGCGTGGVMVFGGFVRINRSAIRDTTPGMYGASGIWALDDALVQIDGCTLDKNAEVGIRNEYSTVTINGSVISSGNSQEESAGVFSLGNLASSLEISQTVIEGHQHIGIGVFGSSVKISSTTIQDGAQGIAVFSDQATSDTANLRLSESMFRRLTRAAVLISGSTASIDATALKELTEGGADVPIGGILINSDRDIRSQASITNSAIDNVIGDAIFVQGSDANVDHVAITKSRPDSSGWGNGIAVVEEDLFSLPASASIHTSIVDEASDRGVIALGATIEIDASTISNSGSTDSVSSGAIWASPGPSGTGADVRIRRSALEKNLGYAIHCSDSTIDISATRISTTTATDAAVGIGLSIDGADASARITDTVLQQSTFAAITCVDCMIDAENIVVTDTNPAEIESGQILGIGVLLVGSGDASFHRSKISNSHTAGIMAYGTDITVSDSIVSGTHGEPGAEQGTSHHGHGIAIVADPLPGSLKLYRSVITGNHGPGLSSYGSIIEIGSSIFDCNGMVWAGDDYMGNNSSFWNRSGNWCGCNGDILDCRAESVELAPLEALPSGE